MLQHAPKLNAITWVPESDHLDGTDFKGLLRPTHDPVVVDDTYWIKDVSGMREELTESFSSLYRSLLSKSEPPLINAVKHSFLVFDAKGQTLFNGRLVTSARDLDPVLPIIDMTPRIKDLKAIADEDDIEWSLESETAFAEFVARAKPARVPSLFLTERGSLRAVWNDEQGQQAAFHFVDSTKIQVVYFVLRSEGAMARTSGIDTLDGVIGQISASGLLSLLR